MDYVALTLRLDLTCPKCKTVGIDLRTELPVDTEAITKILADHAYYVDMGDDQADDGVRLIREAVFPVELAAPTVLSCSNPDCDQEVSYGPLLSGFVPAELPSAPDPATVENG